MWQDETNQETHELTKVLGKRWAKVWLDEFRNTGTGKNTHKYLSSAGGVWSADTLSDDEISKYDGTQATNNVSEKGLGIKTGQIQTHNMISFTNASAIAMAKFNKAFALDHKDKKKNGYYSTLKKELQVSLFALSMSLVPTVRQEEHYKIEKQQEYKRIQQEVEVARRRKKATKEYEDRLYHWLLYKSDYRW